MDGCVTLEVRPRAIGKTARTVFVNALHQALVEIFTNEFKNSKMKMGESNV